MQLSTHAEGKIVLTPEEVEQAIFDYVNTILGNGIGNLPRLTPGIPGITVNSEGAVIEYVTRPIQDEELNPGAKSPFGDSYWQMD